MGFPWIMTCPESGLSRPHIMLIEVVFPAPFGPSRPSADRQARITNIRVGFSGLRKLGIFFLLFSFMVDSAGVIDFLTTI